MSTDTARTTKLGEGIDQDAELIANKNAAFESERLRFEAGEKGAILDALSLCSFWGMAMPQWLSAAFNSALRRRGSEPKIKSWDDVFGAPYRKGMKPAALGAAGRSAEVYFLIWEMRDAEIKANVDPVTPIDDALFESIGQKIQPCASAAVVKRAFYAAKKMAWGTKLPIPSGK